MRQKVQKINSAINKINQESRQIANKIHTEIRKVKAEQSRRRQAYNNAVSQYKRAVVAHNSRMQLDRARASTVATRLRSTVSTTYNTVRLTTVEVIDSLERIEAEPSLGNEHAEIVRLAQAEVSNSMAVAEDLLGLSGTDESESHEVSGILEYLGDLSSDLLARWNGAMYALNPLNPDAARHFCTSAREIFTEILEGWASDKDVLAADPNCELTPNGNKPTRRAKIKYLLSLKSAATAEMVGFVDADIDNVLGLFKDLNGATHGPAGKFEFSKLQSIRKRVEGGIMFLATIAA